MEKLITTVHKMHNITTPNEKLFATKLSSSFTWYLTEKGVNHYAIHSLQYIKMLRKNI